MSSTLVPALAPPAPPITTFTSQVPQRVLSPYSGPRSCDSQKLISHCRRSRSQYHPNPPPYRRPMPPPTDISMCCGGGISSAPDLYTICPLAPPNTEFEKTPEEDELSPMKVAEITEEDLKDREELEDNEEVTENEDAEFDSRFLDTPTLEGGEKEAGGGVDDDDEDIKFAFLVTPSIPPSSESSSVVCLQSSSTEQRRRLSMQSSLKLLQELVQQNQEERLGINERKSNHNRQQQHNHNNPHQQKTSKAAVLRDGAELIRSQRAIRDQLDAEIARLKAELDSLQESVK